MGTAKIAGSEESEERIENIQKDFSESKDDPTAMLSY